MCSLNLQVFLFDKYPPWKASLALSEETDESKKGEKKKKEVGLSDTDEMEDTPLQYVNFVLEMGNQLQSLPKKVLKPVHEHG